LRNPLVKIRLSRFGTKKSPYYRIVAVDSRNKRDGMVKENLGYYHPISKLEQVKLKEEKILKWLESGAQMTLNVKNILKKSGTLAKFREQHPESVKKKKKSKKTQPENSSVETKASAAEKNPAEKK
jgi:small subunit ribosomal protein S16